MFADDTNLFHSGKNLIEIEKEVNVKLLYVVEWLQTNLLSLNVSKTSYIIFTRKQNQVANIFVGNTKITWLIITWFGRTRVLRDRPRTKRTLVHKQVLLRLSEFLQFLLESLHRPGRNHLLTQTVPSVDNPLRKKVLSDVPSKTSLDQLL